MTGPLFRSVLVANRGEIAARILRSVKALGLRALLVAHPLDKDGPAVALADELRWIEGPTPVAAYLDAAQIIAAAKAMGADAVHPGYGFLSENPDFARAVAKAGLTFVGPRPETMVLMGDKVRACRFASEHGLPVVPSATEEDDPRNFLERASALGAPLLIKPRAGGGGKGMRLVRDLSVIGEEIERARSEAERNFGDGRLFAERYIERPRHIEVQVLGDGRGNVIHLFERECSLQRRFQKIIEEAPSPALAEDERRRICEAAVAIARAARYANAGTVEFIYSDGAFYFLEMNTRLQVEHPVTEMITGVDLIAAQLRIAGGGGLPFEQSRIACEGHAIELRLYAEDPARDFLPTTGRVLRLVPPPDARLDLGVAEGSRVSAAFDPMIGKLIVHAADRRQALARAIDALGQFVLLGLTTNMAYLKQLLMDADVQAGAIHTGLIAERADLARLPPLGDDEVRRLLAAAAPLVPSLRAEADAVPALHAALGAWRN